MNREPRHPIPHQHHHHRPDAATPGRVTASGHLAQARAGQPEREARAHRPAPALHNSAMPDRGPADRTTGDRHGERKPPAAADRLPLRTPAAAAQLLAVPESWLRRKAAARVIPCTFLGRHLRFSPADLVAIAAAGAQQATPAAGRARHRGRRPR